MTHNTRTSPPAGPGAGRNSYLERLRLRAELALSLVPLVAGMLDEPRDRGVLVIGAVACWLALPAAVRARYQAAARGTISGMELFGWDYHAMVEHQVVTRLPDPGRLPDGVDEQEVVRAAWLDLVRGIERRRAAGNRWPADWLAAFPLAVNES